MKEKGLKNPNLVYITVESGGSGFGRGDLPLNLLATILEAETHI